MVWPLRPMIRPTSLWRSCTLKIVILPLGISVNTMSSGNSTNWRMMNSRNSFMADKKLTTNSAFAKDGYGVANRHESHHVAARDDIIVDVSSPVFLRAQLRSRAQQVRLQLALLALELQQRQALLPSWQLVLVSQPSSLQLRQLSSPLLPDFCFS